MSTAANPIELRELLESLAADLEATPIRVGRSDRVGGDASRQTLLADIHEYFVPRLEAPGAPLVVAVTGPSGVGVSSVVNALAGVTASPAGVLRPTTRVARIWAPAAARGRWWERLLQRLDVAATEVVVGESDTADREWVLVDVPAALGPSESLDLAARADLCIFVNAPSRYADAEAAALAVGLFERGVPTWFVLNKLPDDTVERFEMLEAYAGLLHSWNLIDGPSADAIETAALSPDREIAPADLEGLRAALDALADDESRRRILEDAIAARLAAVSVRTEEIAEAIEDDRDVVLDMTAVVARCYAQESERISAELDAGDLRGLTAHSSWLEAAVDLSGILTRRAGLAAQCAASTWEGTADGRALLADGGGGLWRHGENAAFESQGLLEAWYEELGDLGAAATSTKRVSSRRRRKLAAAMWPMVVDPGRTPVRVLTRRLGDGVQPTVSEARVRLAAAMTAALERDGSRFETFLGSAPDVARLGRILTAASFLATVEPTGLDRAPGPAWGEAEPAVTPDEVPGGGEVPRDGEVPGPGEELDRSLAVEHAVEQAEEVGEAAAGDTTLVATVDSPETGPSVGEATPEPEVSIDPEPPTVVGVAVDAAPDEELEEPTSPLAEAAESGEPRTSEVAPAPDVDDGIVSATIPEVPTFDLPDVPPLPDVPAVPAPGPEAGAEPAGAEDADGSEASPDAEGAEDAPYAKDAGDADEFEVGSSADA